MTGALLRNGTSKPFSIARLAEGMAALRGWKAVGLAMALGALAALALPPFYFVPLLIPAFTGLLWQLAGATRARGAFLLGWAFGFGYFVLGLYWIGIAMTVDLARFGWFMPVSVGGLSAGLALFTGTATAIVHAVGWRGPARILLFTALWLLAEFGRGTLLSGFPWNLVGTVWSFSEVPIQAAALFGVWGLSAVTVLAASAPALLAERLPAVERYGVIAAAFAVLAVICALGAWRLSAAPNPGASVVPDLKLRLVQPSIDQKEKWRSELRDSHILRHIELTQGPGYEEIDHVIWPETAVPYLLNELPDLAAALGKVVPPGGRLITGAPLVERDPGGDRFFNSLFALDETGEMTGRYDKARLVPFGEFVPMRWLLDMAKVTPGGDFTAGPGPRSVAFDGLPLASPLICYEVIFSGRVTQSGGARPELLLNLTNDGWFGQSTGPFQHFANARLRAVEEGLPLIRAANNGISAVIDPYGRTLQRLELNAVGVIDTALPKPSESAPPFARIGLWIVPILCALLVALAFASRRSR